MKGTKIANYLLRKRFSAYFLLLDDSSFLILFLLLLKSLAMYTFIHHHHFNVHVCSEIFVFQTFFI